MCLCVFVCLFVCGCVFGLWLELGNRCMCVCVAVFITKYFEVLFFYGFMR